jgi:hypothetical protein
VYTITAAGRKRFTQEAGEFARIAGAIINILQGA